MKKFLLFIITIVLIIISVFSDKILAFAEEHNNEFAGSEIFIKAINPGYTIDGKNNVGEMIEIARTENSNTPILLADIKIDYTNSSGNTTTLVEFPEHAWMVGESVLLRLASSPDSELAAATYAKTLAFKAGPLELKRGDEVLDEVCWNGKDGCMSEFKSSKPTTLVRNTETWEFEHVEEYIPTFNEKNYYVEPSQDEGYGGVSQCRGLIFSEILSFYETEQSEQFIELYNSGAEQILMDGCQIKYKNKYYGLSGIIGAEEYYVRKLNDFSLTKNPATMNTLELIDMSGEVIDKLEYPNGQRKGTSYAMIGYDGNGEEIWHVTYAPTPGEPNNYQEYRTCEAGKVLNEVTGNCVKVTSVSEKICPAGQYLNILTGRCRKIAATTNKETVCKEGYYLNEETGRCRKIQNNDGADYSIKTETYDEYTSFVALYVVIGIVVLGIVIVIYEFRHEILKFWRKVCQRFR